MSRARTRRPLIQLGKVLLALFLGLMAAAGIAAEAELPQIIAAYLSIPFGLAGLVLGLSWARVI